MRQWLSRGCLALALLLAGCGRDPVTLRQLEGAPPTCAIETGSTALLLVDLQREYRSGPLRVPALDVTSARAAELLGWARSSGVRVVHVRRLGAGGLFEAGRGGEPLDGIAPRPGEWLVERGGGGAFTATDLGARLRTAGVRTVIVAGLTTHLAVDLTARAAALEGAAVIVVADATATRDLPGASGQLRIPAAAVHAAALAALADHAATICSTDELVVTPSGQRGSKAPMLGGSA